MIAAGMVIIAVASMLIAARMAQARHRSLKAWVWIAAIVGPFGPLTLYLLGERSARIARA